MDDGLENRHFEYVALEVCLEAACSYLHNEIKMLEPEAYDKQTTIRDLEHFREIKRQVAQVDGRLTKIKDELDHLVCNDGDTAEMYLTEKIVQQCMEDGRKSSHLDIKELKRLFVEHLNYIRWFQKRLTRIKFRIGVKENDVKIKLDEERRHLQLVMSTINLVMNAVAAAVAIVRLMNIENGGWVAGGILCGATFLFVLLVAWSKHMRLL